jgi:hypothetical protein
LLALNVRARCVFIAFIEGEYLTFKLSIEKDSQTDKTKNITWLRGKQEKTTGIYCLKTDRKDLSEQQIWDIYTMLTDIEDAFRCMKSELDYGRSIIRKRPGVMVIFL